MRPITVSEVADSYASKISLQRRLAIWADNRSESLSVATGVIAVTVISAVLVVEVFYFFTNSR